MVIDGAPGVDTDALDTGVLFTHPLPVLGLSHRLSHYLGESHMGAPGDDPRVSGGHCLDQTLSDALSLEGGQPSKMEPEVKGSN